MSAVDVFRCERCRKSIAAAGRSIDCWGPSCERSHRVCLTCEPVECGAVLAALRPVPVQLCLELAGAR